MFSHRARSCHSNSSKSIPSTLNASDIPVVYLPDTIWIDGDAVFKTPDSLAECSVSGETGVSSLFGLLGVATEKHHVPTIPANVIASGTLTLDELLGLLQTL